MALNDTPKPRRKLTMEFFGDARAAFFTVVMLIIFWWSATMFAITNAENKATEKFFDLTEWCAEKPGQRRKLSEHFYLDCSLGCSALLDFVKDDHDCHDDEDAEQSWFRPTDIDGRSAFA